MKRWSLVTACLMMFSIVSAVPVYAGNWVSNGSMWEYHENGQAVANKWIQSDGAWYFIDTNGNMLANKWVFFEFKRCDDGKSMGAVRWSMVLCERKWKHGSQSVDKIR